MNKKFYEMNNRYFSPNMVLSIAFIFAMGFYNIAMAQVPTLTTRFANPSYQCSTSQYCLDIEFQSDTPDQELFGMNVRFFYDDADMDIIDFSDFQGGYGPSAGNPGPVVMSAAGFGSSYFNFPAPGVVDFINFAFEKTDGNAPPIILGTADWTKLLQVCFTVQGPVADSSNFCPPIVWDLRVDPADGGYLSGDDGVVMTVVAPPPTMSSPVDENVVQYNWMYSGNGIDPPFGDPIADQCIDLFCIPTIACPADITIECNDSTDPMDTGFATASDACMSAITVTYNDVINGSGCTITYTIERTWTATNECGEVSVPCVQLITLSQLPTLIVRFNNPDYSCVTGEYCLDVELQADMPNVELFGMNVRFFYDDSYMELIGFSDFQGGYGPVAPDPPSVQTSLPGFGTDFFNYPAPGIVDFVNGAVQLVDDMAPPIYISTNGWTKIFQVCFLVDGPVEDSTNFCPPVVWDLEQDPANGGYLPGDDGVVITIVNPPPAMSGPATENVQQFNWMYTGDGSMPPYGEPVEEQCISLFCTPTVACPADITIECNDSTDPMNTGFATATDDCGLALTVTYTDVVNGSGCLMTYTIERTWTAINECGEASIPCLQIITVNQLPTLIVRFNNPDYSCLTGQYCLDVELQADMPNVELFGMNVRFFYDDSYMELIGFSDFQGGYGPVAPDPPSVQTSLPGFGTTYFNYPAPGIVDFVNGAVQLVDDMAPPLYISTNGWTKIFQICFQLDESVQDTTSFCPPVVWDLEVDPANGGYLPGDDGVVLTIVNPPPAMSGPATENVQQFNWMYSGNGIDPPFGEPVDEVCLNLVCLPDIVCPADVTLECTDSTDPADTGLASATDMCMLDITISYNDEIVTDTTNGCVQTYIINRTWLATNECNFTDACVQVITVRDTSAPILVCPPFITISCDDSTDPAFTGMASASDNCDPAPVVTYIDIPKDGPCAQSYTIDRIWSGTDACGNTIFCRQEITLIDSAPPTITCPVDLTLECDDVIPTDLATATDNCSPVGNITIAYEDIACDNPIMGFNDIYDFANWTIINPDGGSVTPMGSMQVMIESVDDSIPCPMGASVLFQIVIPSTGQLVFDWDFTSFDVNGPLYDPFGYNLNGTFYQLTDDNGPLNQFGTASVAVTAGDVFAFEQNSIDCILGIGATTVVEFFACIDQMEETCSQLIVRQHTATDECGNSSMCVQTIYITDTTNPGIVCPADITIECTESTDPANTGIASATDNCDATPDISYTDVTVASQTCVQEYTINRTWTATDACGNITSCLQVINVDDSTPPVITCPADLTLECDESTDTANTGLATATDNCDLSPVITYADAIVGGACPQEYTLTRTWTATDACGNSSTCNQTIFVEDTTPPVISCPAGLTIECDESTVPTFTGLASATDNCDTAPLVTYSDATVAGACPQEYTITRTWTATDACGNAASCDQVIVIDDSTPPTITFCPPSVTIECDESTDPANTGLASATDNCDTAPIVTYSDVTLAGNCPQEYTITRTWTATDACGNGTNCTQVITVDDSTPPTITLCPANITIECDESTDPANTGLATATDNCDPAPVVTYTDTTTPGACPQEYTILRVWNVTDACGNGTACTQLITVDDSTPPTLTCAVDVTIECDESTDPLNTGFSSATDNCTTAPVVTYTDVVTPGACPQEMIITRTWTATDECGNGTNCTQVITVEDTTPPTITFCPVDVTIECDEDASPLNTGFASATDNCDTAPIVTYNDVTLAGACPQEYSITRTWTATDACGNSSTCAQSVNIEDTTAPIISCPSDITIECDEITTPDNTGLASATDNCDTAPIVTYSDASVAGGCPQEYTITRTWTATDACGNSTTCAQVIVVDDSTPPTITCPADMTLECTDAIPTDLATATDNCSSTITITYSDIMCDNPVQGFTGPYDVALWTTTIPAEGGSVTMMGDTEVMLTSADGGGCAGASVLYSVTITSTGQIVFDWHYETMDFGPVFDPFGYNLNGTFYQLTNNNGNNIQSGTATVAVTAGDVFALEQQSTDCIFGAGATTVVEFFACIEQDDEICTQLIIRTHSATDECDNTSSCVQTIFFEDTVAPEITCAADVTIECDESTDPANTGLTTATDFCDPTPDISYTDVTIASQTCVQEYTIERTWTATDNCGNTTTCLQVITVDDSTPPVLTCAANVTIECDESIDPINTGSSTATDNCDAAPIVDYSDITLAGACPQAYTITRTWIATDACGNTSTCDQTISVEDSTPPLVTCPASLTIECSGSTDPADTGSASATDNCDPAPVVSYNDVTLAGNCPQEYTITRTWTATDACGNGTNCIQVISIEDNTAPVFNSCPVDVTIQCDESTDPADTGIASATDSCSGVTTVTYNDVVTPGACPQEYTITRTWTATDECGNETVCGFVDRLLTSEADFSGGETHIDFDENDSSIDFLPANGTEYADQGVTFSTPSNNLFITNWSLAGFPTLTNSPEMTFTKGQSGDNSDTPLILDFESPINRVGFYIGTNNGDDINISVQCFMNNSELGTEFVVTDLNTIFFGLESVARFDRLVITAVGSSNDLLAIDDLRFEGGCCVQTIKVIDTTPPILVCAPDVTIECNESTDPMNTGLASATDNCDTAPIVTYSDVTTSAGCAQQYTITRTWTATDACGNGTNCTQVISILDTTAPEITCPGTIRVQCDESTDPANTGTASATDNCDAAPVVNYTDVTIAGSCPQEYDIQRTWTATDRCGNSATCFQLIVVEDTIPPVLTCPESVIVECDESTDPADLGVASATDNCGPVASITYSDLIIEGACPQEMTITRTWTATDACGNEGTCAQIILVEDSTPPTIVCPDDLTLECSDPVPTDLATATDNCSSAVVVTYSDVICTNPVMGFTGIYDFSNWTTIIPAEGGSVTTMGDNEIMMVSPDDITVSCDDAAVQFSIVIPSTGQIVFDWHFATVDVGGPSYDPFGYNLNGTFYQLTDDNGNDIQSGTATVVVTAGDVFAFEQQSSDCVLGSGASTLVEFFACIEEDADVCTMLIIRTHVATDECDNEASCVQTIYIEDSVPPTITFCPTDVTIECDESTLPDNTGLATATDNCLTEPIVTYDDVIVQGECIHDMTITRTWMATDLCGNTTTCVQVIDVADTTPPVLVCAADVTIECDESTDPINTGTSSATDNCDAGPVVVYNDVTIEGGCPQEYTIIRTWTATDTCGNSSSCLQTIVIDDSTPPVITCPADITIDCNDSTDPENTGFASATDNCDNQLPDVTYTDVTIEDFCPEVIERTWSSTDACGNVATCVQTITRDDTTPPMIICPGDVTVECASDTPPVLTGGVTVSDNCGFVTVTHDGDFVSDSTCVNQYTISRVYRATDECGNTATCTQTIEVDDQTPPVIACPVDITVDCAEDVPTPDVGSVSATDNCEGDVVITHINDVTISQTCVNQFVLVRTYAATDACGNSTTCQQTITVFDDIAPSITCPASVTVECAEDVPPVNTGAPIATDNCNTGLVIVTWLGDAISNQTCVNRFTVTRTYQAADACGNSATCTQIIIVDDQTAPSIVCPPNITVTFGDSESPDNTGLPTGEDNCGTAPPIFTFADEIIPGPCDEEYTIIRTWTATDACGNFATCEQEIFVDGDCIVDLALTKVLISDFEVDGGDNLLFQITVVNQGEVTISSLAITDFIPLGFSLNDPNWTPGMAGSTGQSASIVLSIANGGLDANGLNPGEFVNVNINLLADIDIAPGYYFNCAEILNMFDLQGNNISDEDIDSTPDSNDTNDPAGEDDFDCAPICVLPDVVISGDGYVCPEELVTYTVNDYNPDFTYDWTLSGGGMIVADNGSDIDIQWQEEPGGPFQITLTVTLGDGCSISAIYFVYIQGVETIACNDHIQISLGDSCETVLLSGIILEGENEGNNNYFVVITDEDGNVIPDATLTSEHIGGTFTVTVMNECNGQSCWGSVTVEDKIRPVIICADVTVSCGTSLEPVYEPPVTGSVSETITPALPIGPNGGTVTTAEIILDVPSNAVVTDVNVSVDLNHTWVGDIDVVLVSPSGTQVVLADQICGSVDNWDNVTFDDEAGISVTASCNPIPPALAGSVIPEGVLASIDGQSAVGTWKLVITDNANGDAGTLNAVTLDVNYYLAVPSAPYAYDACGEVNLTYTEIESGDACDQLTLTRLWTATDGSGNTSTCVQTISITPLTLDNVDFPAAYVGVCGESILPNNTGWPTVDGTPITDDNDLCNIFVGYWDKELSECGGGRKIARYWTVLDWCAVEIVEAVQVIKLTDDVGPELTCPANMSVGTDFWYCYANVSVPKPAAIDECSEIASYNLTASSGIVVSFGNNFVINGLEIGTHTATWTVSDECGNSTTCSFQITVVDDVVPVANCDSHTTISLTNDGPGGVTLVPASVFDDGSYDNCGPVTFRARRMESCIDFDWTTEGACIDDIPGGIPPVNSRDRGTVHRPCVPFACCDVGAGPIMVELEVMDAAGNVNYCMIEATIQDKISPFVECPPNDIIVSCDFWFNVQEGTFVDGEGNNNGSLDEDPLSAVFGNMFDAFRYDESVRQNVIINDPGNTQVGQPHNWGLDGWADDNCEVNLSVRVRVIDDCSGGDLPASAPDGAIKYIERRFSATDGNVGVAPGTCTQRIWVVDFAPFYIADIDCKNKDPKDGVIWPCDVLLTTCPEDLGNTGEPTVFDDACSLIGVTYEDERFDFVDGACFKILRKWSVIDWCQYNSQTGEGLWHYTQVIKVHDEDGPEFVEPCETVVLCVEDEGVSLPDNNQAFLGEDDPLSSSCSVHLNLSRVVHETCSDIVNYDVKIYPFNGTEFILIQPTRSAAVDSNNNATLSFDTRQSTIQDIRKNGLPYNSQFCGDYHRILWSVEDGCGNWSHCEYLFRLEDCKKPSPVCINGLSTVVMPIGGEVTVWAKDFNASSFDDCTPSEELLYSFSGDAYQPSFTYTCENIPAFNVELAVQIWVADGGTDDNCNGQIAWTERNTDYCTTTIVITDNNNVCNGGGSILAGEIFTELQDAVAQVGVRLTSPGQFFPMYTTTENGKFEFIGIPFGDDYVITPERDDAHRNGVSTLDLVRIQKHLLGKEPFTSPYQYIAADANNSKSISAIDLVEIRKLILGLYTEFPANQSWRFVEKDFDMDNENPWPFSEFIELPELAEDSLMHNDFVGVKIGDVNNTAKANALQILPRSGRRVLRVELDAEKTVEAGDVIDVRLVIPENIEGFQWTLETEGLTYAGVYSESIKINDSHVGVLNNGIITMSWNEDGAHAEGVTQEVELQFVANTSGTVASMIHMTGKVTEAEAYTSAGEILDVKLGLSNDAAEFALYQNTPNPWNDQTSIGFDLPEDASVTFTVFDATGKIVKTVEGDFVAGYNTIIISAKDLPTAGVMYYRLESGTYSASKKMVLIK